MVTTSHPGHESTALFYAVLSFVSLAIAGWLFIRRMLVLHETARILAQRADAAGARADAAGARADNAERARVCMAAALAVEQRKNLALVERNAELMSALARSERTRRHLVDALKRAEDGAVAP